MIGNTFRNILLVVGVTVLLASCDIIPVDPDVQVGTKSVDSITAAAMFNRVCVDTAPTFVSGLAILEGMDVFQRAGTGTYFHQDLNLSVKVFIQNSQLRCSMVFFSNDNSTILGIAMAAAGSSVETEFKKLPDPKYYRAVAFGSST